MGSGTNHKNRYFPRMNVEVLLSYRPESSPESEAVVARTKTLGLGGLMLEAESAFEEGSLYRIDLVFGDEKMSVRAKVVYAIPTSDGSFDIGFVFEDLADAQRDELTGFFIQEYDKLPPENF